MTDQTRPLWANLPHGDEISALLDELRTLSPDEARAVDVARSAARGAAWEDAMNAAWDAAGARCAASDAAWYAGRSAALRDLTDAEVEAMDTALDAARALVVADLVGQYGLTREHLDTLTAPARAVPRLSAIIDRALPEGES